MIPQESIKKSVIAMSLVAFASLALAGCGGDSSSQSAKAGSAKASSAKSSAKANAFDLSKAKDGSYTAESAVHDKLGRAKVTVTIQDHKITKVDFVGLTIDDAVKDENYGKDSTDPAKQKMAQAALKAHKSYVQQLMSSQNPDKVDMITGATISYNQFKEASKKAIDEALK